MKGRMILVLVLGMMACAFLGAEGADKPEAKPKRAALPVVLNLLPGLGVGAALGQALTLGYGRPDTSGADPEIEKGMTVAIIGCGVWAASKVFGVVRPIAFANRYNREHGLARLGLAPTLRPSYYADTLSVEPGLALRLSY
jgi:hypothetical protein